MKDVKNWVIAGALAAAMALGNAFCGWFSIIGDANAQYAAGSNHADGFNRTVIGGSLDVESGGEIDIEAGGALNLAGVTITASAAEINSLDQSAGADATFDSITGGDPALAITGEVGAAGAGGTVDLVGGAGDGAANDGGDVTITTGAGVDDVAGTGGDSGDVVISTGVAGGDSSGTGGISGVISLIPAEGGDTSASGGTGGAGGAIVITGGEGGDDVENSAGTGGNGGAVTIDGGAAGTGNAAGAAGIITIGGTNSIVVDIGQGTSTVTIAGNAIFSDGVTDVDIQSHDGTNGLQLGSVLVTASAVELNEYTINVYMPIVCTSGSVYVPVPHAGDITLIQSAIDGILGTGDVTIDPKIATVDITNGDFTITAGGSAAGDVDSSTPTAANAVAVGDAIEIDTDGNCDGTATATFSIVIAR